MKIPTFMKIIMGLTVIGAGVIIFAPTNPSWIFPVFFIVAALCIIDMVYLIGLQHKEDHQRYLTVLRREIRQAIREEKGGNDEDTLR